MTQLTPSPKRQRTKESIVMLDSFNSTSIASRKLSYEHLHSPLAEDIYKTPNKPLEMLVKQSLQMRQICKELHNQLGTIGQKYVNMLLGSNREKENVYGVYFSENSTMVGNKQFDLDTSNFVIVIE